MPAFDEEAERAKYRMKGWSPAKIERAIHGRRPQERTTVAAFRDSFALVVHAAGTARILAHSFSGDAETEYVAVRETRYLPVTEYLDAGGAHDVDVLHHVQAG